MSRFAFLIPLIGKEGLTEEQIAFMPYLLEFEDVQVAARVAGVSGEKASLWYADPVFRNELWKLRKHLTHDVLHTLDIYVTEAYKVMRDMLNSKAPSIRLKAAEILTNQKLAYYKMHDIEERISDIEARLQKKGIK